MPNQESLQDKTEKASPYKLKEAKKQGKVAKSSEVQHFAALSILLIFSVMMITEMPTRLLELCRSLFLSMNRLHQDHQGLNEWISGIYFEAFTLLAPLFSALLIVGIGLTLLQTGPVLAFNLLKPDLSRINPIQGAKRFFNIKFLYESIKTLFKVALFTTAIFYVIHQHQHELFTLGHLNVAQLTPHWVSLFVKLLAIMLVLIAAIAAIDLLFTRWDFLRQMRMTKHEVKEEVKRRDGDPQIRQKRRELNREQRKGSGSLAAVSSSDFVITNPIHYAVAIQYDQQTMAAPQVVCKGAGERAQQIKSLAYRHHVEVIQQPALARQLFKQVKIGHPIPESTYLAIANIIRTLRLKNSAMNNNDKSNNKINNSNTSKNEKNMETNGDDQATGVTV